MVPDMSVFPRWMGTALLVIGAVLLALPVIALLFG